MSIFDATHQTTQFTIDDAYALKSAFVETMDALKDAQAALARAENAANRVHASARFQLRDANESDVVAAFWTALLRSLPARMVMSHEAQEDLDKWVGSHEYRSRGRYPRAFPEFTIENILEKATEVESQSDFHLRNWALTVYKHFVGYPEAPHEVKVPQRVTADGYVSRFGVRIGWQMRNFADLDRLFHYLDGRPAEEFDPYNAPAVTAVKDAVESGKMSGETDYFKFRCYQNGNLHLTFKRRDLIAQWESLARQGLVERMNNIY